MRTTLSFILRLLVDADDPQALRGVIRSVGGAEEHAFADEQALLVLLRQVMGRVADAGHFERHNDSGTDSEQHKQADIPTWQEVQKERSA